MRSVFGVALALAVVCTPVLADRDKDESGHGRKHRGEYKEEYSDGNCKVERKWGKNGDFKEEVKCKEPRPVARYPAPAHPVGGAVVIRPPAVVIQPPAVVIEPAPIRIR